MQDKRRRPCPSEDFRLCLYDLADPRDVRRVLQETSYLGRLMQPEMNVQALELAFDAAARLHTGNYPGFPAWTDGFRRLETACATVLAAMRLMHGAHVLGRRFSVREIQLLALAALFHDPGDGRGGDAPGDPCFALRYLTDMGFPAEDAEDCARLIRQADPSCESLPGPVEGDAQDQCGRLLAGAVLLARMADRRAAAELAAQCSKSGDAAPLRQARDFLGRVAVRRLHHDLDAVHALMLPHFGSRWGVDRDLYMESAREAKELLDSAIERIATRGDALS